MITEQLGLPKYNAAYSNLPLIYESNNITLPYFNYLVNICYNACEVTAMAITTILTDVYTQVTVVNHKFVKGDKVLIFTGQYKDQYIVKHVIDSDTIIIDLLLGVPFINDGLTYMCKFIPYKFTPDPEGQAKLDITNTIKDFVKSSLIDGDDILDASSTKFEFFMVIGEEYQYQYTFEDNSALSGGVGFYNTSITDINDIKFNIGDTIQIQQNTYVWNYTDFFFNSGELAFTGPGHSLLAGDDIIISGQILNPGYNGPTKVKAVLSPTSISTFKSYDTSGSGAINDGSITANIPPEYNTTATITEIYIDGTLGAVIKTDLPFVRNTSPIGGTIKSVTDSIVQEYNFVDDVTKFAYDIRYDRLDYLQYGGYDNSITGDNYIVGTDNGKICTIANNAGFINPNYINFNRIEFNTKSFLLVHADNVTYSLGFKYKFYLSEQDVLDDIVFGTSYLYLEDDTRSDLYFPIGISQLNSNANRIDVGSFDLEDDYTFVKYYTVTCIDSNTLDDLTKPIYYKINSCNSVGLPVYQLMWKDSYGSWISYPFKLIARESTDTVRSQYAKREGYFKNNTFNLPTIDRGDSVFYTKSKNTIQLSSDWVDEYENKFFQDMIKSSEVFLQTPDFIEPSASEGSFLIDEFGIFITDEFGNKIIIGSDAYFDYITFRGYLVPVVLQTTNIQYGTLMNDSMFRYDPVVSFAFNDYRF